MNKEFITGQAFVPNGRVLMFIFSNWAGLVLVFILSSMLWTRRFPAGWGLCSHSAIYAVNKEIPSWVGLVFPFSYICREQGDSQLGGACVPIQLYVPWTRRFPAGWGLCSHSAIHAVNKEIPNWVGLMFLFSYTCCEQEDSQLGGACSCSAIDYYAVNKDIHIRVGLECLYPIWPPHYYRCSFHRLAMFLYYIKFNV